VEKVCIACSISKPIDDFYTHPMMADGHLGRCKECQKDLARRSRAAKIDYYREYDRKRAKLPHRISLALEVTKKWKAEDNRRVRCHNAVARALRNGSLVSENCVVCGSEKSLAHHEDYDKPLDVVWLCQVHHKARHKEMKEDHEPITNVV
jgi:hypothetical protein